MESVAHRVFVPVVDYLAGEPLGEVRHEYIGGEVHAMAGGSREHNRLALNLATALDAHLGAGSPCQVYSMDVKVRLVISGEDIFYYPDVLVACDARDTDRFFLRFPKLIIEILSPATEATDRREKLLAYRSIPTLEEYVLVAQDRIQVSVYSRTRAWAPQVYEGLDQLVSLESVGLDLAVATIYRRIFA
jgi:Uma2 family endonuclease